MTHYYDKNFKNRDEHLSIHKLSVEISSIIQAPERTQSQIEALNKINKLFDEQSKKNQEQIINYHDCWLLSVACFYKNILVAQFFLENGANTKKLEEQLKNSPEFDIKDLKNILENTRIIEEDIYLNKNIPSSNSPINKPSKF